jgi:phage shock protein E
MLQSLLKLFKGTDYNSLLERGAVIIDVRTPAEYKGGHIDKSTNVPLQKISGKVDKIKKLNKPVILCCASGMRSGRATSILKSAGVEAYNGGGWLSLRSKI